MEHILILLAMGLLLNDFNKLSAELNVIPSDTEVMANDTTYLNCSTSLDAEKVQWRHGNNYVYAGRSILEPYNVRFSVEINSSTGTNNLVIRSVQPSDAGQYECLEDEGSGERRSAQLIVLHDDPVCKSSMRSSGVIGPNACGVEPEDVKFSCSITYYGNIFPILQWKASRDNQSIIAGPVNFTSNKNHVTYTLTMISTLDLNNSSFICQTTRTSRRNYSCSSDVIKILYVFSSKVTVSMTTNDEVTCFANTSQSCSYKWKWFSGDDSITVSNDQILKPNRLGSHRCEATCSIGNKSCAVERMHAEVYSTVATTGQNQILAETGQNQIFAITGQKELPLLVLIALPVGVVIYCWRKKKQEREVELKREQEGQRLIATPPGKYILDPDFVPVIGTNAAEEQKDSIQGLTILDKELFVVTENSSEVEVYDSMKLNFSRRWNLKELINPTDIGSCNRNKCLYIFDLKGPDAQSSEIFKVDSNGELKNHWKTGSNYGYGLSVTDEANVILSVCFEDKLIEYSPEGQLIREINLSSNADIRHPWHAIKLTGGHFLVSHGWKNDDLHRVCVVDANGNRKKSFGGKRGSTVGQMDQPIYLAVDENGIVMVPDYKNSRVLLLDSDLEFQREILSKEKCGLKSPVEVLLDQTNNRLFVLDKEWGGGRISISNFE